MYFKNKKSLKNYYWKLRDYDERLALAIYQKLGVSEIVSRLLALKNIQVEDAQDYLNPTLRKNLPEPYHLLDMEKAVNIVYESIQNKEKICIFGDYDVDGATSVALMKRFFREIGIEVDIYIPDRMDEGYGPNTKAFEKIKKSGVDLIITVDCGITAFDSVEKANEIGLKIIITDHHLSEGKLPNALAIIDPNRLDEAFEHKNLAGVGVAFLFCVALNRKLEKEGYYKPTSQKKNSPTTHRHKPNLLNFLDLVAFGTICDIVPLTGLNRVFVKQGLKILQKRQNLGIKTLADIAGLNELINIYHLGFALGPRINAGGRVGSSAMGSTLLYTEDELEARALASELDAFNKNRQNIEKIVLESVIAKIEQERLYNHPFIFVSGQDWHEGVIGIVASRVKDKYDKPTAILSVSNGVAKASCRSVHGVDLGSAIIEAKIKEVLLEGGGHAMAGGFMVEESRINEAHGFFCEKLGQDIINYLENKIIDSDLVLNCKGLTSQLAEEIEKLGPYGAGNHKPKIILKDAVVIKADLIGKDQNHMRLILANSSPVHSSGGITAMLFNIDRNKELYSVLSQRGKKVDLLGELNINYWAGNKKAQFIIEDGIN